jgi:serine/threonine protein kinase
VTKLLIVLANIDNTTGEIQLDDVFVSDLGVRHWRSVYSRKASGMIRIPGSQRYVAPEVIQDGEAGLTTAVDVWAIGCIGYELVTGRPLFDNDDEIISYAEMSSLDPGKTASIRQLPTIHRVLEHCLKPQPENRWNVWDLLGNLRQNMEPSA